jgi:predicted N-formylglutamate amidohydrolase
MPTRPTAHTNVVGACVVTCEHGGNVVPAQFRALFVGKADVLRSHRGFDAGALVFAKRLAAALAAPLVANRTTRLLIDLNRSPGHAGLYSEITRGAPREVRAAIFSRHYLPHRRRIEEVVEQATGHGKPVLHLACHSFTPVLAGEVRNADVGLLYDPQHGAESELCRRWIEALHLRSPRWKARRNYPYTGSSDGVCTALRKHYAQEDYLGIEIELNQRHLAYARTWQALCADLIAALQETLGRERSGV